MRRQRVSEAFKCAGNDLQKTRAWQTAKHMYDLSLNANPHNLKALSNRAFMNLQVSTCLLLLPPSVSTCTSIAYVHSFLRACHSEIARHPRE